MVNQSFGLIRRMDNKGDKMKEKCVGRNCNHIFPIEDVTNNMNENEATWNEWAGDGFLCGKCSRYLSIAEDISDAMSSQDMDIDMEYCVDSAYMLIDTYNCYKKIEEEENERRMKEYSVFITRVTRIPIKAKNKDDVYQKIQGLSDDYIEKYDFDEHIDIEEL